MAASPVNPQVKRSGTAFVDFARRCADIVLARPFGVDQDIFLNDYYGGVPPMDRATRDFEWSEFKRARDYSNSMFDKHVEGWVWMRARHGHAAGQFYYQAVAHILNGEPEKIIAYPVSEALHNDKVGDWMTRTRSHMRVKVANIHAKKRVGLATGRTNLVREAEAEMDEITVLAPRLADIYFDTGLTVQDLRQLAISTRVPVGLLNAVKRTLQAYERSQREVQKLSQLIYMLKQLRQGGRP
jgi:hypothetical protein